MENLTNDTPPKRGFGPPLVRYVFQVSVLCFPVQKSTTEQTRSSFGGVQKHFRESAFSGTFSSPHTFCTPPYHGPIWVEVGLGVPNLAVIFIIKFGPVKRTTLGCQEPLIRRIPLSINHEPRHCSVEGSFRLGLSLEGWSLSAQGVLGSEIP